MIQPTILAFVHYYLPGYKSGGPVILCIFHRNIMQSKVAFSMGCLRKINQPPFKKIIFEMANFYLAETSIVL